MIIRAWPRIFLTNRGSSFDCIPHGARLDYRDCSGLDICDYGLGLRLARRVS